MVTPVIHPRTESLRELVAQFDKAPAFAKLPYAREFFDQSLTLLAETLHRVDKLEARVATLERFPELRQ
jgi:BMFP domain-containing protein YqiC